MSIQRERFINPLTDFGFKRLFGTEPNKDILISFLNELLPSHHRIKELSFGNNEQVGNTPIDRKAIFDLYCIADSGERFIVELQKVKQKYFKDRSLFYATFPIQEQAEKGDDWLFRLEAVYTIGILDFTFDEDASGNDDFYHLVELKDQHDRVFFDKLKFIYVELPKFTKKVDQLSTEQDKWLYVLRHMAELEQIPSDLSSGIFGKLFSEAKIANFSSDELAAYRNSIKYSRDLRASIWTAAEEGREKGLEEGREKGRTEKALEIARTLKASGVPTAVIAASTGLAEAVITDL
jgi:predicted transposase/invertase (TIGR01784 family)